jgi:hypothetical protein
MGRLLSLAPINDVNPIFLGTGFLYDLWGDRLGRKSQGIPPP